MLKSCEGVPAAKSSSLTLDSSSTATANHRRQLGAVLTKLMQACKTLDDAQSAQDATSKLRTTLCDACDELASCLANEATVALYEQLVDARPSLVHGVELLKAQRLVVLDSITSLRAEAVTRLGPARLARHASQLLAQVARHERLEDALLLESVLRDDGNAGD